jgi:ribonuclease BN (tRNA processing enzyme)
MKLTIVGCSPAWPNPGSAHSGYLVEAGGRLLLDCGPGVLGKLREENEHNWPSVDSIVISHWHLDHWGDLVPWVWGWMFGLGRHTERPELWVPPDGIAELVRFGTRFGTDTMFAETFQLKEYAEATPFTTAAGFEVTPLRVPHYSIETYAMRVTNGNRTLAYSGDAAPSGQLVEAAREADLFLCEATLESGDLDNEPRGHLSAAEAVAAFEESAAKRLLLTHRPLELELEPGLELAYEGLEVEL